MTSEAPPLPKTLADLPAWSVYADRLLELGDPFGAYLARELSLTDPSEETLTEFHVATAAICRMRSGFEAGWQLGHVKSLSFHRRKNVMAHEIAGAPDESFPAFREILERQRVRPLSVMLPVTPGMIHKPLARALAALPLSCRRLELSAQSLKADHVAALLDLVPAHIEELSVIAQLGTPVAAFIQDRFVCIDVRSQWLQSLHFDPIAQALERTSTVRLRVGNVADGQLLKTLGTRVIIGAPDDAALIETSGDAVVLLERASLESLQRRHGVITVHAQLTRSLPEPYGLEMSELGIRATAWAGDELVRQSDGLWSLRLRGHERRLLRSGDTLELRGRTFLLQTQNVHRALP